MLDEFGLAFTAENSDSAEQFNYVLDKYLGSDIETMPALDALLDADAEMPMALLFRAYMLKLSADPKFRGAVNKCVVQVQEMRSLNDREQRHLKAMQLWQGEKQLEAADTFDSIVRRYPQDMLALKVSHYLHFYGQGSAEMLKSLADANWNPGDRYYGYFQGMLSFALEESNEYSQAERIGRQALEINRQDIWATHAVTHVLQMQNRFDEGVEFIDSFSSDWSHINNFIHHLHWHKALQLIGRNDHDAALALYDELLVSPLKDDFYLDVCNAASLLWRLEMLDVDVGARWQQFLELSQNRIADDELVFITLHYLMAPAVLQDVDTGARALKHFDEWSSQETTQGIICNEVGKPMAQALWLIGQKKFAEGSKLLASVRKDIHRIGGSHAQRHLFEQLIEYYQYEHHQ